MVYIYEQDGVVQAQRGIRPEADRVIELKNMIPEPIVPGKTSQLRADFESGRVWFDLIETVDGTRARVIAIIEAYDKSGAVNEFYVAGIPMWFDRETRTSLARTVEIDIEAGATVFSMWYEGAPPVRFDIPIERVLPMLDQVELYAQATYNVTQSHIAAVYALESVAELEAYDYTTGYPEKLMFEL